MSAWRNWALRVPILKQWQEYRDAEFVVEDIVIEAPGPASLTERAQIPAEK